MTHRLQVKYCESIRVHHPDYFKNTRVLDCGSLDINGNNRHLCEDGCFYLGVDVVPGKNVDVVCVIHQLPFVDGLFDVILSTNALEHDMYWKQSLGAMCRMLRPGGLMFFSASRGHSEHGTTGSLPQFSGTAQRGPEWANYYRNLDEADIRAAIDPEGIFSKFEFCTSHADGRGGLDLYFWGIKKHEE